MTDQIMMQLAKLQTENRNLKQDIKKSTQLLLKRDDEKTELIKEIEPNPFAYHYHCFAFCPPLVCMLFCCDSKIFSIESFSFFQLL